MKLINLVIIFVLLLQSQFNQSVASPLINYRNSEELSERYFDEEWKPLRNNRLYAYDFFDLKKVVRKKPSWTLTRFTKSHGNAINKFHL